MGSILITGASRGLGRELFNVFYENGWNVFPLIRSQEVASELLKKHPERCFPIVSDVGHEGVIEKINKTLKRNSESLDLLINNAGYVNIRAGFQKATAGDIADHFNIHCLGAFRCIKGAFSFLRKSEAPKVINISSRWSSINRTSDARGSYIYAYNIAKAAQNMLTASFQNECANHNIEFVAVHPGQLFTDTPPRDANATPRESAENFFSWVTKKNFKNPKGLYDLMEDRILDW